jgi:hypothetical protein
MVDPIDVLDKLNKWYREWQRTRDSLAQSTLKLALDSCHALVTIQDVRSDAAVLLHERVKSLYQLASSVLANRLQPEELETVIIALGSARMYYWIRYLNGATSDELEMLIRRKLKIYGSIPASLGAVQFLLQSLTPGEPLDSNDGVSAASLERLRHVCLADFAQLEVVVDRYNARRTT